MSMLRDFIKCCLLGSLCVFSWSVVVAAQNAAHLTALSVEIEPDVAALRGLPFRKPVETTTQSPEALRQVVRQEIERTYPGATLRTLAKRLLKFGFVVRPVDVQQLLTQLLAQQIAGYYDPRTQKLALIESPTGAVAQGVSFEALSKLVVERMGYSLEKILLAHELTHALQDQHFKLLTLPFEALDPEDAAAAVKALIEGDATLVMVDYLLASEGTNATQVPDISATFHAWANSPLLRGFNLFQTIPRYITENLMFSYTYGFDFVLQLKQRGGWELVNRAYQDWPASTEQILHPAKYLDARDQPVTIHLPPLPDSFAAWQELERNTLGEFNIMLLLDGYLPTTQARRASAGWGGDRFALYEQRETGRLLLAWYATWDTEQDAREFFRSYRKVLAKRYKDAVPMNLPAQAKAIYTSWQASSGAIYLERRGADVLLLDGAPAELLAELVPLFWQSAKGGK